MKVLLNANWKLLKRKVVSVVSKRAVGWGALMSATRDLQSFFLFLELRGDGHWKSREWFVE